MGRWGGGDESKAMEILPRLASRDTGLCVNSVTVCAGSESPQAMKGSMVSMGRGVFRRRRIWGHGDVGLRRERDRANTFHNS